MNLEEALLEMCKEQEVQKSSLITLGKLGGYSKQEVKQTIRRLLTQGKLYITRREDFLKTT
jgi:hypothetical protein